MGDQLDLERVRERRAKLLRDTEEHRVASALRRARRGAGEPASRRDVARHDRREALRSFGGMSVPGREYAAGTELREAAF